MLLDENRSTVLINQKGYTVCISGGWILQTVTSKTTVSDNVLYFIDEQTEWNYHITS